MRLKRFVIFVLLILVLGVLAYYWPVITGGAVKNQDYEPEPAFVLRVIDGDTIEVELNENKETIRFLGINTPEKGKEYYEEAKDYLKEVENKSIEVLRDLEDVDKYDRKLRYVFYNRRLINVEILQEGLATSFMLDGLKYENKFKTAEEFAKKNEINLWEKSSDKCASCINLVELNYTDEFFIIKNICSFNCDLNGWLVKDDANHFFKLNSLNSGEEEKYESKIKVWNDDGDRFFMRDDKGKLVIFEEY